MSSSVLFNLFQGNYIRCLGIAFNFFRIGVRGIRAGKFDLEAVRMSDRDVLLKNLEDSVLHFSSEDVERYIDEALELGIPRELLKGALFQGMERVRLGLMSKKASIPEFLLTVDAMNDGLSRIVGVGGEEVQAKVPIVIGVVEQDPHDLGKNIIASIYRAYGHPVTDLGRDVAQKAFVDAVGETGPGILALSAMMSTTMEQMKGIIHEVKTNFPKVTVMVGGAFIDETIAKKYGADGYAESAIDLIDETNAALRRVKDGGGWS
jgi:methanogenic corrinoid protein MtbC1